MKGLVFDFDATVSESIHLFLVEPEYYIDVLNATLKF